MKKFKILALACTMLSSLFVRADEGMWFLMFIERLNHRDMEKMGLQLTAEEIYSINNSSLKDAIVQFNGGCTAEIISKEGLVLTNHHCGYDAIAELSSPEHNYLKNGFWAKERQNELKPKSLYVRFFVRMDDVSKRILGKVNDKMSEEEREKVINQEIALIQKENSENGKYTVSVRPFFQGNEYYYFVYQDYTDVRLVGTPEESIGKFGGDTDNWEWPRHTGDFSLFRIYANASNEPAEYSVNNVPLSPKHALPVNASGVKENDFSMILGYPGRTNRWMPAGGIEQNVKFAYPAWVEGSKVAMDQLKNYMSKDEAVNLIYASKYASLANYWKNRQGMIDALSKFETAKNKAAEEAAFDVWANKRKNRKEYGQVVKTINNYYALTNVKSAHDNYLMMLLRSSSFATVSRGLGRQLSTYAKADEKKQIEMREDLLAAFKEFYAELYLPAEVDVLIAQMDLYAAKGKAFGLPAMVQRLAEQGELSTYVKEAFDKSIFRSFASIQEFIDGPNADMIAKDPLYLLSESLLTHYSVKTPELTKAQNDFSAAYRKLVKGLRESKISSITYPDANSTLRLTYGKVRALPADSRNDAQINNYTTLDGMVKKHKDGDAEFDLPESLRKMASMRAYGDYADEDGSLHVNFLTDHDITGGNSGSPVLNGKGQLIGLAFDGNIEAMAGDVIFDANLQRTINVDIRFVLWVIDTYSGAKHLVDEMEVIR